MTQDSATPDARAAATAWFLAARPKTLEAGAAPVLMATAMAYEAGAFHGFAAFCALLGSLLIQIGTNYANDYFDFVKGADTAARTGPVRATQAGLVTPAAMRRATVLVFGLACVPGAYLVWRAGWPILVVGLLSILFGVLYTGGPYPLGYLGLGEVFVLAFFGLVAVGGTYYVQALELNADVIVAGFAPGLLSVAILAVNNLRDIDGDRAVGKRTLAAMWGRGFARFEYLASVLAACLVVPLLLALRSPDHGWVAISGLALVVGLPALRAVFTTTEGGTLNDALAQTGKLLLAFGVLFSLGWVMGA